ncbi:rhodanese-like domain-containing protein [Rhodoferax sp.]|uniref:rhodanese-like domain-containing protein n=1 Tax=Rhodoferax sp. TaxID=50421 RepID=UPI0026098605|nr:rhodanese-like domain-containing protein [Rhodoferax sp.]MDD2925452.1 rhodanese-like domain-containing protein [Rhodoferax sp.]
MRIQQRVFLSGALAVLLGLGLSLQTTLVTAQEAPASAPKANWYTKLVDMNFVKQQAVVPKIDGVMVIDARPTARKYDIGHIPTAVNIPDSAFDKLAPTMLPADKSSLLIFYCDGPECILSHNSAYKAEKLGYTNVRVYAAGFPDWIKGGNLHAVSVAYLKKLMDEKKPITIIDARPKARKYDVGHIPGAINLPDSQFEKMAAELLPADKSAELYFYCDGLACKLSNDSAMKATKLGYTNVKVVPEGYPAWVKAFGEGPSAASAVSPAAAKAPEIEAGKEAGTISVASFERIYKEAPNSVYLIDVREPQEFASGTFKGAINMPVNGLDNAIDKLPTDKPIIFFCGAGGRSGEAHDMVKLHKPALKTVFLDAEIKWTKDGNYTIKGH